MGDIKIFDIAEIKEKCNIDYFVETGTLHGDTVEYVKQFNFKKIISFEIMNELAEKAKERFKGDDSIEIVEGDSSKVLEDHIKNLNGNILFWLDAHFPGADIGIRKYTDLEEPDTNLPLQEEVAAVKKRKNKFKDVIIIDDLWIYDDTKEYEWGSFNSHMRAHGHEVRREDICNGDASFIKEAFNDTHKCKEFINYQGSLVFLPNK